MWNCREAEFTEGAGIGEEFEICPFPDKVGNLIPTEYYSQIEKCYSTLRKPLPSYTTKDKEFFPTFKFCFDLRPPMNQCGGLVAYDGAPTHGGGENWQDDQDNRNSGGNWQNEQDNCNSG